MAFGIDFTANIYLSRQDYGENIYRVEDEIKDLKKENCDLKERMLMLVAGDASLVCTKDCGGNECDAVDVLHSKFNELLGMYDENSTKIQDLCYYKEYLKEKKNESKV